MSRGGDRRLSCSWPHPNHVASPIEIAANTPVKIQTAKTISLLVTRNIASLEHESALDGGFYYEHSNR